MDILGYFQSELQKKFIRTFYVPWNLSTGHCKWSTPQGNETLYFKGNTIITVLNIILYDVLILLFIHLLFLFYDCHMIFNHMCPNGTLVQDHPILWKLYPLVLFVPGGISFLHYNIVVIPFKNLTPREHRGEILLIQYCPH